jgi:hypothetical protein
MKIVREEIFGPVVVAAPFSDLDEIAAQANDTDYGLGAGIWTTDISKAHALANLPALRKAAARAGCPVLAERIHDRHIDLFAWTRRNLLLPIPAFGLKEVSEHFGVSRQSGVSSGLEAEMLWRRYQLTGDQELKAELISYNMDDLSSLVRAVECLRACAAGRPFETAGPLNTVLEARVLEREPGGPPIFRPHAKLAHPGRRIRQPVPKPREAIASTIGDRPRWRERILRWAWHREVPSSHS